MDAKEKAKELVKKFRGTMTGPGIEANDRNAPVAAILCCDEIFEAFEKDDKEHQDCHNINSPTYRFYERVKEEIQKL